MYKLKTFDWDFDGRIQASVYRETFWISRLKFWTLPGKLGLSKFLYKEQNPQLCSHLVCPNSKFLIVTLLEEIRLAVGKNEIEKRYIKISSTFWDIRTPKILMQGSKPTGFSTESSFRCVAHSTDTLLEEIKPVVTEKQ